MNLDTNEYGKFVRARAPKSPVLKNCLCAFLVGGGICAFAEALFHGYLALHITEENVKTLVPVTLIFLAALLTGFGVFDDVAKIAGAGTLVPITGFANAVASPAIDNKSEGLVLGVGAQMFTVAGPVIVYGVLTSVIYGFIYWIWGIAV
ncbi:MAG: stage V sporulation protein AC [Clostridia bacterium]|nr:stage V sporulation protein AC [Clostridia bacterium]